MRWVSGWFGVWVDLGLGLGLRRGCRVVWFRVGCCERCWGVGSRGERGSLGPKLQGSHGTGQHPQHCQHHPQDADDAGEWGDHTIGGGATWPRDWYINMYHSSWTGPCMLTVSRRFPGSMILTRLPVMTPSI